MGKDMNTVSSKSKARVLADLVKTKKITELGRTLKALKEQLTDEDFARLVITAAVIIEQDLSEILLYEFAPPPQKKTTGASTPLRIESISLLDCSHNEHKKHII